MVIKAAYYFVDSNLGVLEMFSKREVNRKMGDVLDMFGQRGEQMTYLGEGRACLRDQG